MSSKKSFPWRAQQTRTRQVTYGPPAFSTKARSQWDGVSLHNASSSSSSSSSRPTEVTPVMAKHKRANQVINLCDSDESIDLSIEEPPKKKTRRNVSYSLGQTEDMQAQIDLATFYSYGQWQNFVPMTTASDKKKTVAFKKVTSALLKKAKDRHSKNIEQNRDWSNHYVTALESLHKCAWVFEVVPNLTGDLEKTFKGIGARCASIIFEEVRKCDALNLWSDDGINSKNSGVIKFVEDRAKVDTFKSFVIFLRENSNIILSEHDNIVNIFKRDLDVQMLISGYWYQKHAKIVEWKTW